MFSIVGTIWFRLQSYNKVVVAIFLLLFGLSAGYSQVDKKKELIKRIRLMTKEKGFSKVDTLYINRLNDLAIMQRYYNNDSLLLLTKQVLAYSKTAEYDAGEIQGLISLAIYHSEAGNSKMAINTLEKAVKQALALGDDKLVLLGQVDLATEYFNDGNYSKALKIYLEGLERAEMLSDIYMQSIINEEIARLYVSQRDYDQAMVYYKKVKKFNGLLNDDVESACTLSNMASLYADMGELDYAMFNINSSISTFEKNRVKDWLAYAYQIKGKIYFKQNKYEWAMFWYNQSELLHEKLEDERGELGLLNGISQAYFGLKKDSLSERYALEAMQLSDKLGAQEGKQMSSQTLYKLGKKRGDYESALMYHEIYQRLSDSLSHIENKKSLSLLKTNSSFEEQKRILILDNEKQLAQQRNYVYSAVAILLLFMIITFLVKRNEKIQKRLNETLKTQTEGLIEQEKELKEINVTKDKLFSIVAHDLRGPIGAFQGLLKLFNNGEIEQEEFIDFIPKLGSDIDHISFTLNNLLSWGQNQMNGLVTKPEIVSLDSLVRDNINLLSETATSKEIKLSNNVGRNTLAWSDSNQIDIVIRNLISNAIKFTPSNGMITVTSREQNTHWEISVRDTGIGIDKVTLETIFDDRNNHSTYGTNNEKGTGLGLSLCKEMVEKNNGSIWADSMVQRGTTFYFTVPKSKRKSRFKQTA